MKTGIAFLLSIFLYGVVFGHPGIGIVQDRQGNIYYTDLSQVWKISTDGNKTIAVHGVHTHELYMDDSDNLYGEHMWYNGERLNTWGSYAWKLNNKGILDTVFGPKAGFLDSYSFTRDNKGNQYWPERFKISRIMKKTPEGIISTLAEGKFKDIRWMHVSPAGEVYFVDLLDLYKIDVSGKLELVVKGLAERPASLSPDAGRHSIFGIWLDKDQNIYAAVTSEKGVKKISPSGKVSTLLYSPKPWYPTGGLIDRSGNLWLLEYNEQNEARARKIGVEDMAHPLLKPTQNEKAYMVPVIILSALLIGAYVFAIRKRTKTDAG